MKFWRNQTPRSGGDKDASAEADSESHVLSFKQIMKDVTLFGAFTWKERKQMENQKAVELGGKPAKKQRLPLSVARVQMKNQKEREQKLLQEEMALGRFSGKRSDGARTFGGKRKQENRVLRSTEGFFKNGVLDVKHMMKSGSQSESRIPDASMMDRERNQKNGGGGGKKKHGKKSGKGGKKSGKGRKKH